jgi:rhodanese-related sulfurtransferase
MTVSVITETIMVTSISTAELAAIAATGADLIDVREQHDWDAGHIAGSRVVPLETLRADPDAVLARGRAIVFICAKGVRSLAAAKLADRFGYEHVYSLEGGTKGWALEGLPLVVEARAAA